MKLKILHTHSYSPDRKDKQIQLVKNLKICSLVQIGLLIFQYSLNL